MKRYRKKPIVIEATQWFPGVEIDGVRDPLNIPSHRDKGWGGGSGKAFIKTLEGIVYVSPGDWVIRGINNEVYPCRSDIFEKTYEKVEE